MFDELENEIIAAANKAAERGVNEEWPSDKGRTKQLSVASGLSTPFEEDVVAAMDSDAPNPGHLVPLRPLPRCNNQRYIMTHRQRSSLRKCFHSEDYGFVVWGQGPRALRGHGLIASGHGRA